MPMRGAKWMDEATYLTDDDRAAIMEKVEQCKRFCRDMLADREAVYSTGRTRRFYNPRHVGVRVACYTGEPHPIAVITYGPGGCSIYDFVYRAS